MNWILLIYNVTRKQHPNLCMHNKFRAAVRCGGKTLLKKIAMWKLSVLLLAVGLFETALHARGTLDTIAAPWITGVQQGSTTATATSAPAAPAAPSVPVRTSGDYLSTKPMPETPTSHMQHAQGLDLSKWQGQVDFPDLAQRKFAFVFLKASEGANTQDPTYRTNLVQARQIGLRVGSYHFYDSNVAPDEQLQNFFRSVDIQSGDLPPVIDVETIATNTSQALKAGFTQDVKTFAQGISDRYKIKPIIYTGRSFANSNNLAATLSEYPLWIADWGVSEPTLPKGWNSWLFWQYTDTGSAKGINGKIDLNLFSGDQDGLNRILIP